MPIVTITAEFMGEETKSKRVGQYIIGEGPHSGETLGKGNFGKVKVAVHEPTGERVAIKILEKKKIVDVADVERVSREIHILKLIRHPHIIQLYEIIESPKHLFLITEFVENGELFEHIIRKKRLGEAEAAHFFQQLVSGVEHTHKLRIVHRDLKLENLLLDYDGSLRIVDFGLSNTYKVGERLKTACGSPCYAAPEMIDSKEPYEPVMVDIWSTGVILYAMVYGQLPFEDEDTGKLYKKILSGDFHLDNSLTPELCDFLKGVLTVDPARRLTIQGMKAHPWWQRHGSTYYPHGITVGYHKIPVEREILRRLSALGVDAEKAEKALEANRHDNLTTTYYLLLKKFLREGGISKADLANQHFDKLAIEPNQRKQPATSFKVMDLLKMVTSPTERKQPYHISRPVDPERSRDRRDKSKSKSRSRLNSTQVKSVPFYNDTSALARSKPKDLNRVGHVTQSLSKSHSKPRRSPKKDFSIGELEEPRPRSLTQKSRPAKKSHQVSYMIGADTGADWPLEPKFKHEGSKLRNAFRRR